MKNTEDFQTPSDGDDSKRERPDQDESGRATLTREDIAAAVHRHLSAMSRRKAKRLTDSVIEEMVATLASGESLKLHDFGSFVVRTKNGRSGRNPRTGAPVPIEARRVVVFKASPNMKAIINGAARRPKARATSPSALSDQTESSDR